MPSPEVVDTPQEAAQLELAPLVVRRPVEAFLDEHGIGSGEISVERVGEGHSNVTFLVTRGDARVVLRRPPRPPLPPSAHDVLREVRLLRALENTPARVPRVLAACDDESVIGVPFYVMEEVRGTVITTDMPAALDAPAAPRRARARADRGAGGGARRGLARRRPRGLRQAHRLPRAAAAPLQRALGDQQDARAAAGAGAGRLARRQPARVARGHDRPRRLPAREHDGGGRPARAHRVDLRLGDGHDRRPAGRRGLPHDHLGGAGRAGRTRRSARSRRSRATRGSPAATS